MKRRHSKTAEAKRKLSGAGWNGVDRRQGTPAPPLFANLLVESQWAPPEEILDVEVHSGWFRANGHAEDRRREDARA